MSRRPVPPWCQGTIAALALAAPLPVMAAGGACAGSPPPAFELSIASGAMRDGEENRVEVRAHADGCVAVRRPWFLREAGEYELRLDAREWAALQSAVAPEELRKIDPRRLGAQTRQVWKDAAAGPVVFAEPDADVYTLRWREGDALRQLVAGDPRQAAARQPESAEAGRVAQAVAALRALASRTGKPVAAEGAK
ncbi:hypothetical protein [Tahibacter harae]|uniref:Uncharacterized protein n=1 Tax=Tahibacter harae TaxID=2963937 RepID=A0ABT1QM67_9GAMM|nr:hypothetical protein [Tahibacter harae]MCQ4163522.1 hypothetical protein [Tahibacter harae]